MLGVRKVTRVASDQRGFYFGPFSDRRVAAFHLTARRRNMFFTVTDLTGAVLGSLSAKNFSWDRKKRLATYVIESATKKLIAILRAYQVTSVRVFLKISNKWVAGTLARMFRALQIRVTLCIALLPVPHNGCRAKKRRRL